MPPSINFVFDKRKCAICDSEDNNELLNQEFAYIEDVSFLNGYNVVSCKNCGFVYASNIPEQEEFDNYYINSNKYEHEIEQPDTITGKYNHIIKEIEHFISDKNRKIVDIGCARSEVLRELKRIGYTNLTGIDPSVKNIEYLKSKGINGIHGTINDIRTNEKYDVVLFLAVLEHIKDIKKTLELLNNLTDSNGMLIISVPDMSSPLLTELPFQEFSREHINFFTEVSLSNLLLKYGFITCFILKYSGEFIGFFKKQSLIIEKDNIGEEKIVKYIEQSKDNENNIYGKLLKYSNLPVILWGLGTFTQRLLTKNILNNIVAFVDSNPQYKGKKYKNIDIILPNEVKGYNEPIILALSNRYINAVKKTIEELNLSNEVILIQ